MFRLTKAMHQTLLSLLLDLDSALRRVPSSHGWVSARERAHAEIFWFGDTSVCVFAILMLKVKGKNL